MELILVKEGKHSNQMCLLGHKRFLECIFFYEKERVINELLTVVEFNSQAIAQ